MQSPSKQWILTKLFLIRISDHISEILTGWVGSDIVKRSLENVDIDFAITLTMITILQRSNSFVDIKLN